jgi:trehalose 6-phosphate phosphatase
VRYILGRAQRRVLASFAGPKTLLAFDYDGTLAPIIRRPGGATMRASTHALLAELTHYYHCAVISGRARSDLRGRLGSLRAAAVIGNHGIEPWRISAQVAATVARWHSVLDSRLGRLAGVSVENKEYSIAVHYRRARDKRKTLAAIRAATALLQGVRAIPGKQLLNLLPAAVADKGSALREALARLRCDRAIYLGDDETDEDVFALNRPARILAVRVGKKKDSLASYYIRSQAEIDEFLRCLLATRARLHDLGPKTRVVDG